MRVVLDTNVVVSALVSAFVWGGVPYKLIEAASAGEIELITLTGAFDRVAQRARP